jgi:hypothetical protein
MIKMMPDYLGVKDPTLVDQLYDLYLTCQSADGSVDDPWKRAPSSLPRRLSVALSKKRCPHDPADASSDAGRIKGWVSNG